MTDLDSGKGDAVNSQLLAFQVNQLKMYLMRRSAHVFAMISIKQ